MIETKKPVKSLDEFLRRRKVMWKELSILEAIAKRKTKQKPVPTYKGTNLHNCGMPSISDFR